MTTTLEAPAPAPAADIQVTDDTVLAVSIRLHDQKCLMKSSCTRRANHALEDFSKGARQFLTVAAEARRAGEI